MSKTRNTLLIIFSILLIPLIIHSLCNCLHKNSSLLEKLYYDDLEQVVQATLLLKQAGYEHFVRDITDFDRPNSQFVYENDKEVKVRLAENSQNLHVIKQRVINEKDHDQVVVRLTRKNFSSFIAENEYVMVHFYASWCIHSQKLAPEYKAAAASLLKGGDQVAFAAVDAYTEKELAWKYKISGFPTVFLFASGVTQKMYDGKRTRDAIVSWVRNNTAGVPSITEKDDAEHILTDFNTQNLLVINKPVMNEKADAVVRLTGKTFSSFIAENEYVMVDFYAPWCYWSKKLAPEYEAAAATLSKGDGVAFAKVDASAETKLAWKYDISGYPTLLLFAGGIPAAPYHGERTRDALVRWVRKNIADVPSITNKYDAEHVLATDFMKVVGFYDTLEGRDSKELFLASKLRSDIKFYQTTNPEVAKMFHIDPEIKHPVLIQLRKVDEGFRQFVGSFTGNEIANILFSDIQPHYIKERAPVVLVPKYPRKEAFEALDQIDLPEYN